MSPLGLVLWIVLVSYVVLRVSQRVRIRRSQVAARFEGLLPDGRRRIVVSDLTEEEDKHRRECLAALTQADIDWLRWWGWEPPAEVVERERRMRSLLLQRQAAEVKAKRETYRRERALRPSVPMTPEELDEYKRRPLAERQAEANENITGDPTVYPRDPRVDRALANAEAAHKLAVAGIIRFGSGGVITPDGLTWEPIYAADKAEPVRYLRRY